MSKKFFSLIHQEQIHIAPDTKIIPKKDLQSLLNGQDLLESIQKDAENYRMEVLAECEKWKEKAQADGFEEGFKTWVEHISHLELEIEAVRQEFERMMIPLALKAAKKILGREIEQSEEAVVDILKNVLKPVATHKKITVYVNRSDFANLEKNKAKLKELFEELETFNLRERADVAPGGFVIETEGGIINAQLENQWRSIEKAFDQLLKSKKSAPTSPG